MAIIKKFHVSVYVEGKIDVNIFFDEIMTDTPESALSEATSKMYTSGMLSNRICALLKEASKNYNDELSRAYGKFHGVKVIMHVWVDNNEDKSK